MAVLNRLFGASESIAEEIELDNKEILNIWKRYAATVPEKKALSNNILQNAAEIKKLLNIELADIKGEEKKEEELISDLKSLEHSQKIKRVHKLEQCLGYAETKYKYLHGLLEQLHNILKTQMHLIEKIPSNPKLAEHLIQQLELESEIIKKIEGIETFPELFAALVKGEHIIKTMDSREKRMLRLIEKRMKAIFKKEIREGITYLWARNVLEEVDDKIHEMVAENLLEDVHNSDFEYVNRPEFVDFVRETIHGAIGAGLRRKDVSERMITVFVHAFREWYNHERD